MRHRRGVGDQGFDSAEAFREGTEFYVVEHFSGAFERDHVERDHRAEAALLADRNTMLRMRRQSRIRNVLSATRVAPCAAEIFATAAMSVTRMVGFVGVSI